MSRVSTSSDTNRLIGFAQPEIYRANAFRVLGLPVTAGDREIVRRVQEMELSAKFGDSVSSQVPALALDPQPDFDGVRQAAQRLKDPETRFLDEFFWPRISTLLGGTLTKGDNRAIKIWLDEDEREAGSGQGTALHNLAVFTHLRVLDLELLTSKQPLGDGLLSYRDGAWGDVYRYWGELLLRDAFWRELSQRIRELDDPRLKATFASTLRTSLPSFVLTINAQLAVRAAEAGQTEELNRHALIIHTSGFEDDVIDQVLRRAVAPVRQRLSLLCGKADEGSETEPQNAKQATIELLASTQPLLALFDALFAVDSMISADAFDQVAKAALNCLHAYGRHTRDWRGLLPLLEQVRAIASESLRNQIQESVEIVRGNADFQEAEPLFERIRSIMDSGLTSEAKLFQIKRDVLSQTRELGLRLSDNSETFAALSNMLAGALRSISVDLHNEDEKYGLAYEAVLLAQEFGLEAELRKKIEADLLMVREHAESQEILKDLKPIKSAPGLGTINGIGCTLYGKSNHEGKLNSYLTTLYVVVFGIPLFPLGRYRVIASGGNRYRFLGRAPFRKSDKWHIAIFAALVLLTVVWITIASQTSDTSNSTSTVTPAPTQSPYSSRVGNLVSPNANTGRGSTPARPSPMPRMEQLPATLENPSSSGYDNFRGEEAQRLKAEIDEDEASLGTLKTELNSLAEEMSSYKSLIDQYAATIRRIERDRDLGSSVDQDEYNRALKKHNENVDLYNSTLTDRREKVVRYNRLLAEMNAKIDRYNGLIRRSP